MAANRLVSLGCRDVYTYQASKVDWFANELPAGSETDRPQLSDLVDVDADLYIRRDRQCGPEPARQP